MQTLQNGMSTQKIPLISFIIPCYNIPAAWLKECIESIRCLSLRTFEREIILVDDGSETSPIADLDDVKDEIIYIRQRNSGLSTARNTGLRMASGRYIQFIDADDRLLRTPYEHCLDLVRYQSPDMLLFRFTHGDMPEAVVFNDSPKVSGSEYLRSQNIQGTACGYLFRSSILGDHRFTPGIFHEDEEFTPLLILRADTVISTDARAYYYRTHENSIITSRNARHRIKRLNDALHVLLHLNELADTFPTEERIALKRRVHQLTMDYIYNVIRLTRSRHYLDRRLKDLSRAGLYPLPKRDYTRKYTWFRRLANTELGLSMLMRAIPLMKRER